MKITTKRGFRSYTVLVDDVAKYVVEAPIRSKFKQVFHQWWVIREIVGNARTTVETAPTKRQALEMIARREEEA